MWILLLLMAALAATEETCPMKSKLEGKHVTNIFDYYLVKSEVVVICAWKEKKGKLTYSKCKQYKGDQIGPEFAPPSSKSSRSKGGKLSKISGDCSERLDGGVHGGKKKSKTVLLSLRRNGKDYEYDLNPIYVKSKEKFRKQKKLLDQIKKDADLSALPTIEIVSSKPVEAKDGAKVPFSVQFKIDKKSRSPYTKCKCVKPLVTIDSDVVQHNGIKSVKTGYLKKGTNKITFTATSLKYQHLNNGKAIDIGLFDQSTQVQVKQSKSDNANVCPVGYTQFSTSDNTLSSRIQADRFFIDKCNACESNKATCCRQESSTAFHCECPPGHKGGDCGELGKVNGDPTPAYPPNEHKAAMSVAVASGFVIIMLIAAVIVYCVSKQNRKDNKRRSKRRQSEIRSSMSNRSDVVGVQPIYQRQHAQRFVPNQQSQRSQGVTSDTHALLRDGSTAGSILRPSTFGVPPDRQPSLRNGTQQQHNNVNNSRRVGQCDAESDKEELL